MATVTGIDVRGAKHLRKPNTLGRWRTEAGLPQAVLAQALDLSVPRISQLEHMPDTMLEGNGRAVYAYARLTGRDFNDSDVLSLLLGGLEIRLEVVKSAWGLKLHRIPWFAVAYVGASVLIEVLRHILR